MEAPRRRACRLLKSQWRVRVEAAAPAARRVSLTADGRPWKPRARPRALLAARRPRGLVSPQGPRLGGMEAAAAARGR